MPTLRWKMKRIDYPIDGVGFANEGSALRAETNENPRNLPCPTCHWPNRLTPIDVQRGYQCDAALTHKNKA